MAGIYHAIFLIVEVYILVSFILSAVRIYRWLARQRSAIADSPEGQRVYTHKVHSLTWALGAICLVANLFAVALRVDVGHGIIPLSTYIATVGTLLVVSLVAIIGLLLGPFRTARSASLPILGAMAPLLFAVAAAGLQWWALR